MNKTDTTSYYLSDEEMELLLQIATETLDCYVLKGESLDLQSIELSEKLNADGAAFVSLKNEGVLRGCIGHTRFIQPLATSVRDNTVNAAARDPRFGPVTTQEMATIKVEISVLCPGTELDSPFIEVKDPNEIVIGRDGLYLTGVGPRGGGLLLPQVPVEQRWNLEQYLNALCRKAEAPELAWEQPDSKLYRFSAQIISNA